MRRFLSQVLVIARRDFSAIVLTPTFLIFLLASISLACLAIHAAIFLIHHA